MGSVCRGRRRRSRVDVSGRTISDNVREVGPFLHGLGHHPDPIPQRHPNADAVRAIAHNTPS